MSVPQVIRNLVQEDAYMIRRFVTVTKSWAKLTLAGWLRSAARVH